MTYARFIEMEIPTTTFQSKQIVYISGRPTLVATSQAKRAKKIIEEALLLHRPDQPAKGSICVLLDFYFDAPKAHKWQKEDKDYAHKTTKPDIDNLCKGFIDAMVSTGWIENDQSVTKLYASKYMHKSLRGVNVSVDTK